VLLQRYGTIVTVLPRLPITKPYPRGSSPSLQGQPPQQDHEHPEDGAAWDWGKADAGADDHGFPQSSQCHHSYSHYSNINVLVVFTICLGIVSAHRFGRPRP
jgi:hypothetical protein